MNFTAEVNEARAIVQGLREAAAACSRSQGALRVRLMLTADSLNAMTLLATRQQDRLDLLDGALRELLHVVEMWDRCDDHQAATRAAAARAQRALGIAP